MKTAGRQSKSKTALQLAIHSKSSTRAATKTIKLEQMTRKGQPVDVAPGNGIQVKIPNMQGKEKALVARIMNP